MTDAERLDWLERTLASEPERAIIVLGAWYSRPGPPDGFSVNVGDLEVDPSEWPTLREAIDDAMRP